MLREAQALEQPGFSSFGRHFQRQVLLGGLLVLALVIGKVP